MEESGSRDWKDDFYARYSTLCGKEITNATYKHFIPYGKYIVRKVFPRNKNVRILDMGCGIGGFLKVFAAEGYHNIQGVDLSKENIEYAHAHGMVQVKQGDLFGTLRTAEPNSYDVILYLDVIEHFEHHKVLDILNETYRILSPGGRIIIHVPNAEGIFGSRIRYGDFTHEQAFTIHSLSQISRYAGFTSFMCFEDKPVIHNLISLVRRILWELITVPDRIKFAVESGSFSIRLSQNILFAAIKS